MKIKVSLKQRIGIVPIVALLAISLVLFNVAPVLAHIPEGWCPIEECWKYVGGAASGAAAADVSVAATYRAMSMAIDELWDGKPPRRSDIRIISRLPTAGAEHAIRCIVGIPEGEVPPEWKSDNPGEFEFIPIRGTEEKNLKMENFEITIIRKSTGEEYTWRPGAGVFVGSYFKCRNREARGEETKWWQETECASVMGIPLNKLEEPIGLVLANKLHDDYAHPLDEDIIGKVDSEGTMLCLAAALAESGDKRELEALREKVEEASERIGEMHDMVHDRLVPLAEEMGKGEYEVNTLHDLARLMASTYKIGNYLGEIEKTDDVDEVKGKASEMLDEVKNLSVLAGEAHVHSTDPSTVLTEQKPLKLKDAGEVIEIGYEDLQRYYRETSGEGEEKEESPLGGAIALGVIVVGLVSLGVVSRRSKRASLKQKIGVVSVVALLAISLSLFHAPPARAHIPEGWCPIEECWKHVEGAASPGGAAAPDVSVAATYRAMSMATDSLWGGEPPRRCDIEIVSRLPTAGAEHAGHCIVGVPEGEAPSWWTSDSPGEFEVVPGIDEKNLKLEDFEIAIVRKSTGEEYTWKPDADIFPEGYFEYRGKEARDERLTWWEESRIGDIKSEPVSKLEESMFTEQEPLRLEDAGEVIEIEYKDLQRYHSEMSSEGEEKEEAPIGSAVALGVIVVGLVALGGMRARRK